MRITSRFTFLCFLVLSLCIVRPSFAEPGQKKILIGILPEINIFKQKQRFQLLGDHLSSKIGTRVEFTILSRYGNVIDHFHSQKMDGAFFGSLTGAIAIKKFGIVPLVRPINRDGASTYQGFLFVRKDSAIKGVKDMKNRRMVYVDETTTAGYLFPLAYLKENGITDKQSFFGSSFFSGSHDAAVSAVLNRKADVGTAKSSIYEQMKKNDPRVGRELIILTKSASLPSNGLCVRKDLDEKLKMKLKAVLLNLHKDPEGKLLLKQLDALKFIETHSTDYQPVFDMAAKAGIDIKSYDNSNK